MFFYRSITSIADISDLKQVHRSRVPKLFYDYVDEGSYTESTYHRNHQAFNQILFKQRVGVDISQRSLKSKFFGKEVSVPIAIAPVGGLGVQHANGEILVAKAAQDFGIPFTLSTMSICSIESVAKAVSEPFWFQLYISTDRQFNLSLIDRAKAVGCTALVITLDLQVYCQRHKDIRNGIIPQPKKNLTNAIDFISCPHWCLGMALTKHHNFGNIMGHAHGVNNMLDLHQWTSNCSDESLTFNELAMYKEHFGGKLIVKGLQEVEDVIAAINAGADAIVVSNHGGRQLDGGPASIEVLPAIVELVNYINQYCVVTSSNYSLNSNVQSNINIFKDLVDSNTVVTNNLQDSMLNNVTISSFGFNPKLLTRKLTAPIEIYIDGGFYTGQNILKAIALGANGVWLGRAIAHGLGAYGQQGVTKALEILTKELDATIALCGQTDITKVNTDILQPNTYPTADLFRAKT